MREVRHVEEVESERHRKEEIVTDVRHVGVVERETVSDEGETCRGGRR